MLTEANTSNLEVLSVLPFICSQQLGLQGLACLAASSKQLRQICCAAAKADALSVLAAELEAAGKAATAAAKAEAELALDSGDDDDVDSLDADDFSSEASWETASNGGADCQDRQAQQQIQAVAWLLQAAPAVATAAGTAERLLAIPAVP
jgi:hypothetical protein